MTKTYRTLFWLFTICSILLNIGPCAYYVIAALVGSTLVTEKVTLCMTVLVVLILSIIGWINKTTMRSRIWIILLGIYFCLDNFLVPLLLLGITQVLDEWIVAPLAASYKTKLTINKELDKRGV